MSFGKKTLKQKSYITNKALLTIKQVQIIDLKKVFIMTLDVDSKTFIVYIAIRKQEKISIYLIRQV